MILDTSNDGIAVDVTTKGYGNNNYYYLLRILFADEWKKIAIKNGAADPFQHIWRETAVLI